MTLASTFPGHSTLLPARNFSPERNGVLTIIGEQEEALALVLPAPPGGPRLRFLRGQATVDWKTETLELL